VALTVIFFLGATLHAVFTIRTLLCLKWARRLPSLKLSAKQPRPKCSIIFAARDEGARVEQTLHHILALEGVEFEVIPVDDRSRDETSQILKRISSEDPRVKPKRVDVLPENWLGKCHACHLGAQSASGDWLLFTDADCWLKPDVLTRALALAEAEKVEHVTLTPGVAARTLPAEGCHIAFLLSMIDWIANVNRDKPNAHLGIGAFNLVRAEIYRKFGGHETLRLTVVDDIKFGRLVRKVGARTRAFIGSDDVECHWGDTVRNFVKIMEKNYFAAVDYRTFVAILVGVIVPLFWLISLLGPLTGTFLGWTAAAATLSIAVPAVIIARRLGWPIRGALITPFVFPVLYYAILNSTIVTLCRGGVRWRDTFYPLDLLRKGNVR
jgi:glycosyltransferase involved in cell wall biosynthesis